MALRVILRPEVPQDLRNIVTYLEAHSTAAADRFVEAFFAAVDGLSVMPGKGSPKRLRIRHPHGIRSWWVPGFRKYLIFYHFNETVLVVLAVQHGSRNVRRLLQKRLHS
jgi:plasmid stabilization system protein ParE